MTVLEVFHSISESAYFLWLSGGVLLLLFIRAAASSSRALQWCNVQEGLIKEYTASLQTPPSGDAAATTAQQWQPLADGLSPNPIFDRNKILSDLKNTRLMEGDIGAFILRRQDVDHQQTAGAYANILVSCAIVFTIGGLIGAMSGLDEALRVTSAKAESLQDILAAVRGPLSLLPRLFVPTGVGLILGVLLAVYQRDIDDRLERVWEKVDRFTHDFLLARHLSGDIKDDTQSKLVTSVESMTQAVQQLASILKPADLNANFGKLDRTATELKATNDTLRALATTIAASTQESAATSKTTLARLEKLVDSESATLSLLQETLGNFQKLDPTSWTSAVTDATLQFRVAVEEASRSLESASDSLALSLGELPAATRHLEKVSETAAEATGTLKEAGAALSASMGKVGDFIDSQEKVLEAQNNVIELKSDISSLAQALGTLNKYFEDWSGSHQQHLKNLSDMVKELHTTVEPLAKEWELTANRITDHAEITKKALGETQQRLEKTNTELERILAKQYETFDGVATRVAEALRQGHQKFLVEVTDRFDQGEGLYDRMEDLRGSLASAVKELVGMQATMQSLANSLSPEQLGVKPLQTSLDQTQTALLALAQAVESSQQTGDQSEHFVAIRDSLDKLRKVADDRLTPLAPAVETCTAAVRETARTMEDAVAPLLVHVDHSAASLAEIREKLDDLDPLSGDVHAIAATAGSYFWARLFGRKKSNGKARKSNEAPQQS